jgi:Cd2+/Zn2+-exporting ATPase
VVLLLDKSGPLALFAVADTVKDSSREAIANCMSWASRP